MCSTHTQFFVTNIMTKWLISRDSLCTCNRLKRGIIIPKIVNVPIHNSGMINIYITNSGTYLMPCIFGFKHEPFCPCQLINIKNSELDNLICPECTEKFRLDCVDLLRCEKENWTGDFNDFVGILIEERLMHLRQKQIGTCRQ